MSERKSKAKTKESKLNPEKNGRIAVLAAQMLSAPVGVLPPVPGSRTRIWKQDPSVHELAVRDVYVHTGIHPGPSDSQIAITGLPTVNADANGDFLFDPSSLEAFDAVHTYTVVRQVLTMYQRVLGEKMEWQWNTSNNTDPISVFPHAGETANAFYSRPQRALKFFFFRPPGSGQNAPMVFTCRSLDIVSHEVGHAILDALQPGWWSSSNPPQTDGLHESFGDLTSIFLVLSQLDQVEFIIAETKADLHQKNILAAVAEEFGEALGRSAGLRNADNNLTLSKVSNEVHDISKVFTGGVYDVLADAFTASRDSRKRDDAEVLYEVGRNMAALTIQAFKNAPAVNATYADVANEMIKIAQASPNKYPNYDTFIKKHFELREVLGPHAVAGPQAFAGFAASRVGCCGTMQNIEYQID
ncbi:MAG: hypothetical protein GY801_32445 [bacterium]|nr:hypothetical protein [bacterium]